MSKLSKAKKRRLRKQKLKQIQHIQVDEKYDGKKKRMHRFEYLIFGYIRNIEEENKLFITICNDIKYEIVKFYPKLKFDIVHPTHKHCVQQNGTAIKRPKRGNLPVYVYFSICSSFTFLSGINEFKIKCIKPKADVIGIISNTKICEYANRWCFQAEGNLYAYCSGQVLCSFNTTNMEANPQQSHLAEWKQNDIITVRINCEEWSVTFLLNDQQLGKTMPIVPNMPYHAFIGIQHHQVHDTEYKLIL
eukprot:315803_1